MCIGRCARYRGRMYTTARVRRAVELDAAFEDVVTASWADPDDELRIRLEEQSADEVDDEGEVAD